MSEWKECDFENYPEYCRGCTLYKESQADNYDCEVILSKFYFKYSFGLCPCANCLVKPKCVQGCNEFLMIIHRGRIPKRKPSKKKTV